MVKQVDTCIFCDSVPCVCNAKAKPPKTVKIAKIRPVVTVELPEPKPVVKVDRTRPVMDDNQATLVQMTQNLAGLLGGEELERNAKVLAINLYPSERLAAWRAINGKE